MRNRGSDSRAVDAVSDRVYTLGTSAP